MEKRGQKGVNSNPKSKYRVQQQTRLRGLLGGQRGLLGGQRVSAQDGRERGIEMEDERESIGSRNSQPWEKQKMARRRLRRVENMSEWELGSKKGKLTLFNFQYSINLGNRLIYVDIAGVFMELQNIYTKIRLHVISSNDIY